MVFGRKLDHPQPLAAGILCPQEVRQRSFKVKEVVWAKLPCTPLPCGFGCHESSLLCDLSALPDACLQHGGFLPIAFPRGGTQNLLRADLPTELAKPGSWFPGVISHL
jgi:hypothetical protein